MPSTGLMALSGIGNALSQGVDTYLKQKQLQREEDNQKKQLGLLAAKSNLQLDPESGDYRLSDFGQKMQQSELENATAKRGLLQAQTDYYKTGKTGMVQEKAETEHEKALNADKGYQKAKGKVEGVNSLINTVKEATKNQTAAQALPTELALFASSGQRLHNATLDAFKNPNSALLSRIQTGMSKTKTGTIPTDVANDIIKYLKNEQSSAELEKMAIEKSKAESFKKIHGRYPKTYDPTVRAEAEDDTIQEIPLPAWANSRL